MNYPKSILCGAKFIFHLKSIANYKEIESNSVGNKEDYMMHSMDFEEFLWANGNETMMELVWNCFENKKPLGQALHRKAMDRSVSPVFDCRRDAAGCRSIYIQS